MARHLPIVIIVRLLFILIQYALMEIVGHLGFQPKGRYVYYVASATNVMLYSRNML